jgi:hypothetical protein
MISACSISGRSASAWAGKNSAFWFESLLSAV